MSANTLIMMKDKPIMRFNLDEGIYDILESKLLPFSLQDRFRRILDWSEVKSKYDQTQQIIAMNNNQNLVINWLAGRVLPLSRSNAKWIYNMLKLDQLSDDNSRAMVAIICKAVSLQDCYWIKPEGSMLTWKDVDIRQNSLNEVLAQVALHGSHLTIQGSLISPELTTWGAYAKAWRRESGSDDLWLYKLGHNGDDESKIEVMVSNILDKCNVEHLKYEAGESDGHYVCKCKCMTTEDIGILSGLDFITYCNVHGLNVLDELLKLDSESIYKMWIVDYLISNPDRHGQNWGLYFNTNTNELIGCHPLYDHNNAFDISLMQDGNVDYIFPADMTMKRAAHYAMEKVDFYFTDKITRKDFITDRQYNSFMERAKELGIKTKKESTIGLLDRLKW